MDEHLLPDRQQQRAVSMPSQVMEEGLLPGTEEGDEVDEMQKDATTYRFEDPPRRVWKCSVNVYIALGAIVVRWFAFGRGMHYREIHRRIHNTDASVFMLVHVVAAGTLHIFPLADYEPCLILHRFGDVCCIDTNVLANAPHIHSPDESFVCS